MPLLLLCFYYLSTYLFANNISTQDSKIAQKQALLQEINTLTSMQITPIALLAKIQLHGK